MPRTEDLETAAESFARDISGVVSAFVGIPYQIVAKVLDDDVVLVSNPEKSSVEIRVGDGVLLSLTMRFKCTWDSDERYLSLRESSIAVFPFRDVGREPLFRYDFVREPVGGVPCAHVQVHAHRDVFTHLLGYAAGSGSKRARERGRRDLTAAAPSVSEFHFPVGGPRFRPALEDVLDAIQLEFGVEPGPDWPQVRDEKRAAWRRMQVSAAVRDAPEVAATTLRALGYDVTGPSRDERASRLVQF